MPMDQRILLTVESQYTLNISAISYCRKRPKHIYSPFMPLQMPSLLLFSTLFLLLSTPPPIHSFSDLPVCSAFQACAAEVSHFPLLSETAANMVEINVGEEDSSGDGSGHGIEEAFPFYDEFVSRNNPFDYEADADLLHTPICKCPEESGEEESGGCNFLSSDSSNGPEHVMSVDRTLRLAFCRPVKQLFKSKCLGRRGLIRIIGQVDVKTGDAIASVNDTAVFCRCDSGFFQRANIEAWGDQYAFTYRCAWAPPSSLISSGKF